MERVLMRKRWVGGVLVVRLAVAGLFAMAGATDTFAGTITGGKFIVKPWVSSTFYRPQNSTTVHVSLYFQVENEGGTDAVFDGIDLQWLLIKKGSTFTKSGHVKMNEYNIPFGPYKVWPHSVTTQPLRKPYGTEVTEFDLSAGTYFYSVSLIDPAQSNRVLQSSVIAIEIQ